MRICLSPSLPSLHPGPGRSSAAAQPPGLKRGGLVRHLLPLAANRSFTAIRCKSRAAQVRRCGALAPELPTTLLGVLQGPWAPCCRVWDTKVLVALPARPFGPRAALNYRQATLRELVTARCSAARRLCAQVVFPFCAACRQRGAALGPPCGSADVGDVGGDTCRTSWWQQLALTVGCLLVLAGAVLEAALAAAAAAVQGATAVAAAAEAVAAGREAS